MSWLQVSVLLPVLDEIEHIEDTMTDLLAQDYPGEYEIVVADGGSVDGTRELVASLGGEDGRVKLIDNPQRRQAHGLNLAAEVAAGALLVRADGHSRYAPDYLTRSVESLTAVDGAVGGRMNPVGFDTFSRAVAAAMNSPLTMGPARFHHAVERQPADTVYLGAFRRQDFLELGGIRAFPSGSSEDADFYYRWRRSGRRVYVDPSIQSWYAPRNRLGALWRQYWRYGQGKAEMLWVNGRFPSWRPMAPIFLVLGLFGSLGLGLAWDWWWGLWAMALSWLLVLVLAAVPGAGSTPLTVLAAAVMHIGYGLGGLWGLVKGPFPVRHLR